MFWNVSSIEYEKSESLSVKSTVKSTRLLYTVLFDDVYLYAQFEVRRWLAVDAPVKVYVLVKQIHEGSQAIHVTHQQFKVIAADNLQHDTLYPLYLSQYFFLVILHRAFQCSVWLHEVFQQDYVRAFKEHGKIVIDVKANQFLLRVCLCSLLVAANHPLHSLFCRHFLHLLFPTFILRA